MIFLLVMDLNLFNLLFLPQVLEQLNVFAEEDIREAAEALNDVSLNIVTLLSHLRTFFVLQCFSSNVSLLVFSFIMQI